MSPQSIEINSSREAKPPDERDDSTNSASAQSLAKTSALGGAHRSSPFSGWLVPAPGPVLPFLPSGLHLLGWPHAWLSGDPDDAVRDGRGVGHNFAASARRSDADAAASC